jgi:hypothetical protein
VCILASLFQVIRRIAFGGGRCAMGMSLATPDQMSKQSAFPTGIIGNPDGAGLAIDLPWLDKDNGVTA